MKVRKQELSIHQRRSVRGDLYSRKDRKNAGISTADHKKVPFREGAFKCLVLPVKRDQILFLLLFLRKEDDHDDEGDEGDQSEADR